MIAPPASRNDPCPCGSGLRYKHCHGRAGGAPTGIGDAPRAEDRLAAPVTPTPSAAAARARAALRTGAPDAITAEFERLVAEPHPDIEALRLIAEALNGVDPGRAEACWGAVLARLPGDAEALFHAGNFARVRCDFGSAVRHLEAARRAAPGHTGVLNNLGLALEAAGRLDAAEAVFREALDAAPGAFEPLANLAQNLYQQKRYADALPKFDAVIRGFPVTQAALWANRSVCLSRLGRQAEAEPGFERALALAPDMAALHRDLGLHRLRMRRYEDAVRPLERGVALDPDNMLTRSMLQVAALNTARWDDFDATSRLLIDAARTLGSQPGQALSAFDFTVICDDPGLQQQAARSWMRNDVAVPATRAARGQSGDGPLRLGFVSTDLHNHPVGRLLVGLLECLDRSRFAVAVYAIEAQPDDAYSRRIEAAANVHRNIPRVDPGAVAATIRADEIDILFDLNGFTGTQLGDIFALRPAPVQVNFLGYTGTLGSSAYDWIIADHYVIPDTERAHYDERAVFVDPCYLPSDGARTLDPAPIHRAEYGLAADALVFCAPAAIYKVLPPVFGCWMALLAKHPTSVLWLREAAPDIRARLRRAAGARGIDGARLVFAPRDPVPRYLSRMRLADVFLDTFPFGSHTTVNDALYVGLPVVTRAGRSFASRSSASQLAAAGLSELIARDADEYVAIADRLARDPARRAAIAAASTSPLFDMTRYTRTFEAALTSAWRAEWPR